MYLNQVLFYHDNRRTEPVGGTLGPAVINNKLEALKMLASSMLTEVVALEENRGAADEMTLDLPEEVRRLEIDLIRCALIRTGGRQRQAARLLNVKPTTLHEKMKRYGILKDMKPSGNNVKQSMVNHVNELDLSTIS
jgi:DNA-binding NtrC family response regulator